MLVTLEIIDPSRLGVEIFVTSDNNHILICAIQYVYKTNRGTELYVKWDTTVLGSLPGTVCLLMET